MKYSARLYKVETKKCVPEFYSYGWDDLDKAITFAKEEAEKPEFKKIIITEGSNVVYEINSQKQVHDFREELAKKKNLTIKEWLEKTGLSLKEASERTGVPYKTMQNWALGTRKPPEYVERLITEYFGVVPVLQGKKPPEWNIGVVYGMIFASTGNEPDWDKIKNHPLKRYAHIYGMLLPKIPNVVKREITQYMADIPYNFKEKRNISLEDLVLGYYHGRKWCADNGYEKTDGDCMLIG